MNAHAITASLVTKLSLGLAALGLAACAGPVQSNAGYYSLDPAVAEQNREFTRAIEADSQEFLHRERLNHAAEVELATRNMPKIIRQTTIYLPRWSW